MSEVVIETERLLLRKLTEQDAELFFQLNSDPEIMRYTGEDCLTDLQQALNVLRERPLRDYQKFGYGRLACILKDTNEFIGWCGLKCLEELDEVDVGYRFFPRFWGRGLGTEASRACVQYGFEVLKLPYIIGIALPENVASTRVLEKSGLQLEGDMQYEGFDVVRYVIENPATVSS